MDGTLVYFSGRAKYMNDEIVDFVKDTLDRVDAMCVRERAKEMNKYSAKCDSSGNLIIPECDLDFIRSLPNFDLIMLLSEVHESDWSRAMHTLELMKEADAKGNLRR